MNYEQALAARDKLAKELEAKGFSSYPKVVHLSADDAYEVRIVLNPDEKVVVRMFPGIPVVPWHEASGEASPYVERGPRSPSQNTDDYGFYPSDARRKVDGPSQSPDTNPAYPGLRRIPEIQDLVRRVAMREDLKTRLARVDRALGVLSRLESLSKTAKSSESSRLLDDLLGQFQSDGYTGRHKIVRLTRKLKNAVEHNGKPR